MEKDVTRQIEEQLSAFLDGELPEEELALLVRRLERDENFRATLDRYSLIGGAMRNDPVAGDVSGLRRGILEALSTSAIDINTPDVDEAVTVTGGGQVRYLLAASMVVGVMAVFFAGNFNRELTPVPAQAITQAAVPVQSVARQSEAVENRVLVQRQQELRRMKVNQQRMRSYLISHGEYSRPMQGALADSSMYVQQASFTE